MSTGNDAVTALPGNTPVTGNGALPVTAPPVSVTGNTLYYDVSGMLDGTLPEPPAPMLLTRSDGNAIFYAGEVNVLFGDPECGKTMIADAAAAEALSHGRKAVILDLDHNGPASTISRLLMFGAPVDALRDSERFRYVEPEDAEHLMRVISDLRIWRPAVAIVDSLGELIPLFGGSSNSPDDFTAVHTRVIKPLAMAGAAVLCIDHLAKNSESRSLGSTGTAAKRRVIGGTSIRVKLQEPFTPGKGGRALLTIHKDRHGGLRAECPTGDKEPVAGTFVLSVIDGETHWSLKAPYMDDRNPSEAAPQADVEALAALDPPPESVREARERLGWNMGRAQVAMKDWRTALPVTHTGGPVTGNTSPTLGIGHQPGRCPECEAHIETQGHTLNCQAAS